MNCNICTLSSLMDFAFSGHVLFYSISFTIVDSEKAAESYKTRQTFTARHLLERRNVFSNKLISIVKRYHKVGRAFLIVLKKIQWYQEATYQ